MRFLDKHVQICTTSHDTVWLDKHSQFNALFKAVSSEIIRISIQGLSIQNLVPKPKTRLRQSTDHKATYAQRRTR